MEFHEAANIFPLMTGDDFDDLVEDIRKHGLREAIELLDGKIVDGRNRFTACNMAGVEPRFNEIETDDAIAYVLSNNLHRRHLTPSQRAMVAARARECYDKAANERMKAGKKAEHPPVNLPEGKSDARDAAGKAAGVSGKSVDFATKVLTHGTPELIKAVDEGRMAVSTAAVHATDPPEEQKRIATDPKRNRTYTSLAKPMSESDSKGEPEPEPGKSRGVGVRHANEAIDCLKKIPKGDGLRKRGFQIVSDWMKANK